MSVDVLDHFNIRTRDLEETVRCYQDILGLENGARPKFAFPGARLDSEGRAVVHEESPAGQGGVESRRGKCRAVSSGRSSSATPTAS